MKLFSALAVGVLLAAGSAFGAAIADQATIINLCNAPGAICGSASFNAADLDDGGVDNLFIETFGSASLTSAPFSGGVPVVGGGCVDGNCGNGLLQNNANSYIDLGVDDEGSPVALSAIGFRVDQGIAQDGQGLSFQVHFEDGDFTTISSLDGYTTSTPLYFGVRLTGGDDSPISFIRILSHVPGDPGAERERFNLWSLTYVLAEEDEVEVPGVPEPATFGLMGAALLGLGAFRRFRK